MKFAVAFVATLACAFAAPSAYYPYAAAPAYPYAAAPAYPYAAPAYPAYAGAYAHGPAADIKVLPSGFLADTPEVAHAKAAHLAEVAKVASKSAYYAPAPYAAAPAYPYAAPYAGAYAHAVAPVTVLPSGFLADTPEVAHAKAAHLAEKAKVASKSAYYAPGPYAAPAYAGAYAHAAPVSVLPSGFLADTPEVAHAKAAHFAEKAKASAAAAASPDHDSYAYSAPAYPYAAPHYYGSHY